VVVLAGTTTVVKAAHVRLCYSRMLFVRAYPREAQEMVFDICLSVALCTATITTAVRQKQAPSK
jgi:hypothetical protein